MGGVLTSSTGSPHHRQKGKSVCDMIKTISLLIVVFLLLVPVIMWADENIQRNSRRFANLTYILWTVRKNS